jgi:hypothetical protein
VRLGIHLPSYTRMTNEPTNELALNRFTRSLPSTLAARNLPSAVAGRPTVTLKVNAGSFYPFRGAWARLRAPHCQRYRRTRAPQLGPANEAYGAQSKRKVEARNSDLH